MLMKMKRVALTSSIVIVVIATGIVFFSWPRHSVVDSTETAGVTVQLIRRYKPGVMYGWSRYYVTTRPHQRFELTNGGRPVGAPDEDNSEVLIAVTNDWDDHAKIPQRVIPLEEGFAVVHGDGRRLHFQFVNGNR